MRKIVFIISLNLFGWGCKSKPDIYTINRYSISIDSLQYYSVADTIVADMVVKNPDKEDTWMEKCLQQLQRKDFIDTIFQQLYSHRLIAYDYYTGKPMSINELRNLEKRNDYSREIVGKFQFYEGWYYDPQHKTFIKKVYYIIFGYETYDDKGYVKGYKPMFKIVFE